jgi:predicted flavoprotein YhiN
MCGCCRLTVDGEIKYACIDGPEFDGHSVDFDEAIITRGGICVKEVNPSTMESKQISGLYFAGEVLDLDAVTGGFNLQIAWSTGYLAGSSIE